MTSGKNNFGEITELIPQKTPFVMVDKLLFTDGKKTISSFQIKKDNILCNDNFFSENGLVENIAQTAAAGAGYFYKKQNAPVPIGFIAAIKDLRIYYLPELGSEIITEVEIQNKVLDITIISGKVKQNRKLLAECEMRIYIKPD